MRNFIDIVEGQRLDELVGYKGSDEFKAFQDLIGQHGDAGHRMRTSMLHKFLIFLTEKGFSKLGSGAFGAVFTHPSLDYAVKIFRSDPAYMEFIYYILRNPNNPHLPRFRGRFMKLDGLNYVVRMEKLVDDGYQASEVAEWVESMGAEEWLNSCEQKLANSQRESADEDELEQLRADFNEEKARIYQIRELINQHVNKQQQTRPANSQQLSLDLQGGGGADPVLAKLLQKKKLHAHNIYRMEHEIEKLKQNQPAEMDSDELSIVKFSLDYPDFCRTVEDIIDSSSYGTDFHGGNFMLRHDGTPVITDPTYDSDSMG